MALQCCCVPVGGARIAVAAAPRHCEDPSAKPRRPGLHDVDLCAIQRRGEDENSKHDDHGCHAVGERRQNLINKLKMFLDNYDDRPVMKGKDKSGGAGKALGQTGFGPLIKYPGYVDYDHPYFSEPYNKMPCLAMTIGQRDQNTCPPEQYRNWDMCRGQSAVEKAEASGGPGARDGKCRCAERNDEVARCPAAVKPPVYSAPPPPVCGEMPRCPPPRAQGFYQETHHGQRKYLCIPLPDDAAC